MQEFDYIAANSIAEVVSLLATRKEPVKILNGGTDLLVQLREGRKQAKLVVDIKRIPELTACTYRVDEGLWLGSAVPCYRICTDPLLRSVYPGLIDAVSLIGGTQVQGRATVGGNLCNGSPAGDSIPALIVHQAVCLIEGPSGKRALPVEEFCTAPGQTALRAGEFLVALRIPPCRPAFGAAYLRFIPRNEMDIAVAGSGVGLTLNADGQSFQEARVALGAVAPRPLFVAQVGDYLSGRPVSNEVIDEAARIAQAAAQPISDMRGSAEQRRKLAYVLTKRALNIAVERARQSLHSNGNR